MLIPLLLSLLIVWKVKSLKVKSILLIVLLILLLFNPFRLKQEHFSSVKNFNTDLSTNVERVLVVEESFAITQEKELAELRKFNKGIENEIK